MKKANLLILIVMILLAASASCRAQEAGEIPPDFTATDIAGEELTLSDLKGHVVLLDFWATWCPPCRVEVPHLIDIQRRFKDKKFVLISVSLDRDLEAARKFVQDKGMDWVHIIDPEAGREIAEKYQIAYIPSTFVINRLGKVEASQLRGNELKERIAGLLK